MKTVKDYLDLGLVFVDDDKLRSSTNNKDEKEVCMSGLCIAHQRYCDGLRGGNAIFFYPSEWAPSSFVLRNNDGVKPEYKGVIEFVLNGGQKCTDYVSEITWIRGLSYSVAKWRPVVLQSDDAKDSKDESFTLPIGIDSPELRGAFKSLKEHLENKPPFWNKSVPSFSCPCVSVNIKAVKPTVSPKEDKPMKPVYTAEMHARNELPPVDSKVKVCIEEAGFYVDEQDVKFEGKAVTVKAAFSNTESEKIVVVENEDGNCYCYIIECIKPIIKTIKVNGFDVPAPMSEAPEIGDEYFTPQTGYADFYCANKWICDGYDHRFLSRGLVHATESAAIAHAKAMLGIDPNESN